MGKDFESDRVDNGLGLGIENVKYEIGPAQALHPLCSLDPRLPMISSISKHLSS